MVFSDSERRLGETDGESDVKSAPGSIGVVVILALSRWNLVRIWLMYDSWLRAIV